MSAPDVYGFDNSQQDNDPGAEDDEQRSEGSESAHGDMRSSQPARKKRVYFSPETDIHLLRTILNLQPFAAPFGQIIPAWASVAATLKDPPASTDVDHKRCKARFKTLLDAYTRGDEEYLNRTGTPKEIQEKNRLLRSLADKIEEHASQQEGRSSSPFNEKMMKKKYPSRTGSSSSMEGGEFKQDTKKRKLEMEFPQPAHQTPTQMPDFAPLYNTAPPTLMTAEMHEAVMEERRMLRQIKLEKLQFEKHKFDLQTRQAEARRNERLAKERQNSEMFVQIMNKLDKLLAVLSQRGAMAPYN